MIIIYSIPKVIIYGPVTLALILGFGYVVLGKLYRDMDGGYRRRCKFIERQIIKSHKDLINTVKGVGFYTKLVAESTGSNIYLIVTIKYKEVIYKEVTRSIEVLNKKVNFPEESGYTKNSIDSLLFKLRELAEANRDKLKHMTDEEIKALFSWAA